MSLRISGVFRVGLLYFLWKEEAMVVMFLLAALGASIPQADIDRICESAKVDSLPEDRVTAMRGCVGDETSARDQLRREWGRYSAADKNNCASTPGMQFSYVELLTCLEMQRGGNFGGGSSLAAPPTRPMTPPATPEPKP
jgi:hypothetical protein